MQQREHEGIILDGNLYQLATDDEARKWGYAGRKWQSKLIPAGSDKTELPEVTKSPIDNEWIIVFDTFHRGLWGDRAAPAGAVHYGYGVETRYRGRAFLSFYTDTIHITSVTTNADPVRVVDHLGSILIACGRYALIYTDGAYTSSQDLGANFLASDAAIWNNELVVGGNATGFIWVRDGAAAWAQSADTYIDKLVAAEAYLWRSANTNEISNIGTTDAPETDANWTSDIVVGDDDYSITQLLSIGPRVIAAKEEGLFLGDISARFPNVAPMMVSTIDEDNGKQSLAHGPEIFYPYTGGIKYFLIGSSPVIDDVGPNNVYDSTNNEAQMGMRATATLDDGKWIYAAFEPAPYPREDCGAFKKTVNNGAAYTNYTSEVNDNVNSTTAVLDALDTVANQDWIIVGKVSAGFGGILLNVKNPNLNASVMTVEYWNGAWTAINSAAAWRWVDDGTTQGGKSLNKGGAIWWSSIPGDWASSTIDGVAAFYVRVSFSAALSATVDISEARILTAAPLCPVLATRKSTYGDSGLTRYVWYPITVLVGCRITALGLTNRIDGNKGRVLICAQRQQVHHVFLDEFPTLPSLIQSSGSSILVLPKHDGGTLQTNKEFLDVTLRGKLIGASNKYDIDYRVDEDTAWTSLVLNGVATGTTAFGTRPTGRAIQLKLTLKATTLGDMPTEINHVEVRYREIPSNKNQYVALLRLSDGSALEDGTVLPEAGVQLSNLEGDLTSAVALVDPVGRAKTVTVTDVSEVEYIKTGGGYPTMLVQVTCVEI